MRRHVASAYTFHLSEHPKWKTDNHTSQLRTHIHKDIARAHPYTPHRNPFIVCLSQRRHSYFYMKNNNNSSAPTQHTECLGLVVGIYADARRKQHPLMLESFHIARTKQHTIFHSHIGPTMWCLCATHKSEEKGKTAKEQKWKNDD